MLDEACAALGVGVATVHEAMHKHLVESILLAYLHQFEQMVERRMHTAIRGQSHEMEFLAVGLGIAISIFDFWVFEDRAVLACTVDLHQVLVYYSTCTDIEMSHL